MIVAKTDRAHLALSLAFSRRTSARPTWPSCYGTPTADEWVVDAAIDRHAQDRKRMAVVQTDGPPGPSSEPMKSSPGRVFWRAPSSPAAPIRFGSMPRMQATRSWATLSTPVGNGETSTPPATRSSAETSHARRCTPGGWSSSTRSARRKSSWRRPFRRIWRLSFRRCDRQIRQGQGQVHRHGHGGRSRQLSAVELPHPPCGARSRRRAPSRARARLVKF